MTNTVCIMQPTYAPWMGYVDMIDQSDIFILLDTVPINEKSWQTRNRVVNSQGKETLLSIPVHSSQGQLLQNVRIADNGWRRKHLGTLFGLARNRQPLEPILTLYEREWEFLTDFTTELIRQICVVLGIRTQITPASAYGLPRRNNPIDRIADLCERVGAEELLDTAGARDVLKIDRLPLGGGPRWIPIRYHEYEPQPYKQTYQLEKNCYFQSHMSVLDCLARHGPEETLKIIKAGRTERMAA